MKTALILEGGAMRGIYTAGVLDVLLENNISVDCIIGVSAGALFGINYPSKQKGRVLRYNKKYCRDKRYMGFHSLITTGNIMNKEFCFNDLVYKLDKFDFDTFNKSKIKFYAVVTNLETGKPEYVEIKDFDKHMEYLRASGSMPIVSKIVTIDNNKYLDGGLSDSIPIYKALELGYDKIIVVETREKEYRKKKTNLLPYKIIYKQYPNFIKTIENRYINYNKTLEDIIKLENKNKIFVIRPSIKPDIKRIEKDINKIQNVYDLGVKDAKDKINKLKEYLKG